MQDMAGLLAAIARSTRSRRIRLAGRTLDCGFESASRKDSRHHACLVDKHETSCHLSPVPRHLEEEPQHRHRRSDGWGLNAPRGQVQLERA
jgi:hypothetical protein